MAKARSFREGWLTSQTIDKLRCDSTELFLFRLGLRADKNGVYHGEPDLLRAAVYPMQSSRRRLADVTRYRDKCAEAGLLRLWTADDGRPYVQILKFRQKTPNEQAVFPLPPGQPDDSGQEQFDLTDPPGDPPRVNRKEEKSPQPPTAVGGESFSSSSKPLRRTRSPARRLSALNDELDEVKRELTEILYPAGCANKVTPVGEKRIRYDKLFRRWKELPELIEAERKRLEEEARDGD